jgi:hypothetical protein
MQSINGDYGSAAPINLGGGSLDTPTSQGMDPRKQQMIMQLMAQQMGNMGGQTALGAPQRPHQQLDIYGNPV